MILIFNFHFTTFLIFYASDMDISSPITSYLYAMSKPIANCSLRKHIGHK